MSMPRRISYFFSNGALGQGKMNMLRLNPAAGRCSTELSDTSIAKCRPSSLTMSLTTSPSGFTVISACTRLDLPLRSRMRSKASASVFTTFLAVSAEKDSRSAVSTVATTFAQAAESDASTDQTWVSPLASPGLCRRSDDMARNAATVTVGPAAMAPQTPFTPATSPNVKISATGTAKKAKAVSATERPGRPTYW